MYDDSFRIRYTRAPAAVSESNGEHPTPQHLHREIEMLFVEFGSAVACVGAEQFVMQTGDLLFVNPLEVHGIQRRQNMAYCHKCICFDVSLIADKTIGDGLVQGRLKLPRCINGKDVAAATLNESFYKLFSAVKNERASMFFECVAAVSDVFACMIQHGLLCKIGDLSVNVSFYRQIQWYLEQYYCVEISSKHAADTLGYNQSYFCRMFKKCFGICFSEYLNMYRIFAARGMLANPNVKISDIAFSCGFSSPVYFARCFKKYVGVLPSEYKKSI